MRTYSTIRKESLSSLAYALNEESKLDNTFRVILVDRTTEVRCLPADWFHENPYAKEVPIYTALISRGREEQKDAGSNNPRQFPC